MLDLADDARPAPRRLDLVHQRPRRELEQPVARALVLQLLVLEPLPALQRVVVPRAAGEVLVEVVVAVREDVEPRTLLFGDHGRVRVQELLAEADVEQRRVEGRPHRPPSYQRGRGHEPVTVAGSIRSLVAVSIAARLLEFVR